MILSYSSECTIKQVQKTNFQDMIEQNIADIISFIQKEYRGASGKNLRLTREGEADILVQKMSNFRTWFQSSCIYKIGGAEGVLEADEPKDINENIKNWLKTAKN